MKFCPLCATELTAVEIDGKERQRCPSDSCGYVFWNNPTPVVAAIVAHEGSIILARQKGWPEKMFGLVTGFLEAGETPEEAVLREVKEELGLDGVIEEFVGNYSFFQMNQLILVFYVEAQGEMAVGEELEEVKRVPPDKLRPWPIGTGPAVRDWLASRKGS